MIIQGTGYGGRGTTAENRHRRLAAAQLLIRLATLPGLPLFLEPDFYIYKLDTDRALAEATT